MAYRITIKTLNNNILTFTGVKEYKVEDGFIIFVDSKTSKEKRFSTSNTEIEGEDDG